MTPSRQPDRESVPAVQRLRVRYAKRGRLRFTSHRDFQRVFERAVRRAGVPIAYSAGFSPHPKISYVGAASTGAASEAEYLELAVTARCDPDAVRDALDAALPPGFDVIEVVEAAEGSLAERVNASRWKVALPGVSREDAASAVEAFLASSSVPVERVMKDGRRTLDARAAVVEMSAETGDRDGAGDAAGSRSGVVGPGEAAPYAILDMVVRHLTPAVRPDDVLAGLRQVSDVIDLSPALSPLVTRLAQGHLDDSGLLADPLAPDRVAPDRDNAASSPREPVG